MHVLNHVCSTSITGIMKMMAKKKKIRKFQKKSRSSYRSGGNRIPWKVTIHACLGASQTAQTLRHVPPKLRT